MEDSYSVDMSSCSAGTDLVDADEEVKAQFCHLSKSSRLLHEFKEQ